MSILYEIHDNQKKVGDDIIAAYKRGASLLFSLIAQPQSGKSGTTEYIMERLIEDALPKRTRNIVLQGASDAQLKDQNTIRFAANPIIKDSMIGGRVLHLPDFNPKKTKSYGKLFGNKDSEFKISEAYDYKFNLLFDECHLSIGKGQLIPSFFNKFFGGVPGTDKYNGNFLLAASATPANYAFLNKMFRRENGKRLFLPFFLKPGIGFTGCEEIKPMARESFDFENLQDIARFKNFIEDEFLKGPYGNGVMRISEPNSDHPVIKYFDELKKKNKKIDYVIYSYKEKNIDELNNALNKLPTKHMVRIIIDSYSQGKTFDVSEEEKKLGRTPKQFFRFWIDSYMRCKGEDEYLNESRHIQSIGRNFGYSITNKYPIFCNLKVLDKAIEFYKQLAQEKWDEADEYIPTSPKITESVKSITTYKKGVWFDTKEAWEEYKSLNNLSKKVNGTYCATIHKKNKKDVARAVLEEDPTTEHVLEEGQVYFLDGPNPNFQDSWTTLVKVIPDAQGKVVYFPRDAVKEITTIKDRSFLNECYNSL